MKPRIYYTKPSITELEVEYATDAARYGWGDRCYEYIARFESAFKAHLGMNYAIATSSCTGALHMGMAALGIGEGDEVILADTNWIATAAPIVHLGAKPIFVDILPDSWCIDPDYAPNEGHYCGSFIRQFMRNGSAVGSWPEVWHPRN
jgi:perosamine synthetase